MDLASNVTSDLVWLQNLKAIRPTKLIVEFYLKNVEYRLY